MTLVSKQATFTSSCLVALTSGRIHNAAAGAERALTPILLLVQHNTSSFVEHRAVPFLLALVVSRSELLS
jgi:hypothetical protein